MSLADFILIPLQYGFMQRAMLAVVLVGLLSGTLGTFVVLRGSVFFADALSHTVFPGIVIAFLLKASIFLGALTFGIISAFGIAFVGRRRRVGENTAIGILLTSCFALGVLLISLRRSYTNDLSSFLFGNILGVTETDLWLTVGVGLLVLVVFLATYRELVVVSFDPTSAEAMGLPVWWIETLFLVLLALTVVVALQTAGNVLVFGLLVTPAATARLLSDRLTTVIVLAAVFGAFSGVLGLYLSYYINLSAGATIVLVACFLFLLAAVLAPRHRLDIGTQLP